MPHGPKGGGVVVSDGSCCCPIGGYYGPSYGPYGMLYASGSALGGGFEEIILNPGCCANNSHWPLGLLAVAANWRVLSNFGNPTTQPPPDCECTQYNNQIMHYMTYNSWHMDRGGPGSLPINYADNCSLGFGAQQPVINSCIWSSDPSISCTDPSLPNEPEFSTCPKWAMWCNPGIFVGYPFGIVVAVVWTFQSTATSSHYDTQRTWTMALDNFNPVGTNNFGTGTGTNQNLMDPCTNMDPLIVTPA